MLKTLLFCFLLRSHSVVVSSSHTGRLMSREIPDRPQRAAPQSVQEQGSGAMESRYTHTTDCSAYTTDEQTCVTKPDCHFLNNECFVRCAPSLSEERCRETTGCTYTGQFGCIFQLPPCSSVQGKEACLQLGVRCAFDDATGSCTHKPCSTFQNRQSLCQLAGCEWVAEDQKPDEGMCNQVNVICERVTTMLQCLDLSCHWNEASQACKRMECSDYMKDHQACAADHRCAVRPDGACGLKTDCESMQHGACLRNNTCRWNAETHICDPAGSALTSGIAAAVRKIRVIYWVLASVCLLGVILMAIWWSRRT